MRYQIVFTRRALKDLEGLDRSVQVRVVAKIEQMREDLQGDVKRLVNHEPAFRLRVGDYRVLFDARGDTIRVERVLHRREAYD